MTQNFKIALLIAPNPEDSLFQINARQLRQIQQSVHRRF
ncbi:Uncharacterised protein [Vibrio cholerae]|nr:Uncharacterised protein [Vibrio cholerae]